MQVPFLNLHAAYVELQKEIDEGISRVLNSGQYIGGTEVEAFESEWAGYCDTSHAVAVGNGLDAITLALRALDIGLGDEVLVPSNTYIATWLAVSAVGARPVPVEPCPTTHNINPELLEEAVTSRTRAIIPVHLYGQPADLDPVLGLAKKYNLAVIEDAAQSHGARYRGQKIGGHGDIVCWSFYPGKNLGALGDAGAITTNNSDLADKVRVLRDYGSRKKYFNEVRGVNSRLDPLQAAVLRAKLPFLDEWTDRRRAVAVRYGETLAECNLTLPHVPDWASPVWHLYVVRSSSRDRLQAKLSEAGVTTMVHYPIPPHRQEAYTDAKLAAGVLPLAEQLANEVLSLPIGPHLSPDEVDYVITAISASAL